MPYNAADSLVTPTRATAFPYTSGYSSSSSSSSPGPVRQRSAAVDAGLYISNTNASGYCGVYGSENKWVAMVPIGQFDTKLQAAQAFAQHMSGEATTTPQRGGSSSSKPPERIPEPVILRADALNLFDLASLLPPPIRAAPSNDPKLVRTNKDIKGAVKQWCNPATKAAALIKFGHISDWNMSKVTDCSWLFYDQKEFNDDISRWDTSNVKNMSTMFYNATTFNQPIGNWNVAKVTNMFDLFHGAKSFNQRIGKWDVSSVTTMRKMFFEATSFNQPIGGWNVSNVKNNEWMFASATSFNQDIR